MKHCGAEFKLRDISIELNFFSNDITFIFVINEITMEGFYFLHQYPYTFLKSVGNVYFIIYTET